MNELLDEQNTTASLKAKGRVLIADDEESMRVYVSAALKRRGYEVESVDSGASALSLAAQRPFDLLLVDLKMPGMDGLQVLTRLRQLHSQIAVIMMTGFATVRTAIEAIKLGAFDYITKPFDLDELLYLIERALLSGTAGATVTPEAKQPQSSATDLLKACPSMRQLRETIQLLSNSSATVLIAGESGAGKEVVAHAIHECSNRSNQPFVTVSCSSLPEHLLDNELFGHEPGAFTGATELKVGLIERAHEGTLFLDEVSQIPLTGQAKLLRFLQEREITRLGSALARHVNVRVLACTNQSLEKAVNSGSFRQDLYWRLNVVPVSVPPLRERSDDIPVLVSHFLHRLGKSPDGVARELKPNALAPLIQYPWPGNVRELQNTIERMVVMHRDKRVLDFEDLPEHIRGLGLSESMMVGADPAPYHLVLANFERAYLSRLLAQAKGNVSKAARLAGISRPNFHRKIRQHHLDPGRFRTG